MRASSFSQFSFKLETIFFFVLLSCTLVQSTSFSYKFNYKTTDVKAYNCTGNKFHNIPNNTCVDTCSNFAVLNHFVDVSVGHRFCAPECKIYQWVYQIISGVVTKTCIPELLNKDFVPYCSNGLPRVSWYQTDDLADTNVNLAIVKTSVACRDCNANEKLFYTARNGNFCLKTNDVSTTNWLLIKDFKTGVNDFEYYVEKAANQDSYYSVFKAGGTNNAEDFKVTKSKFEQSYLMSLTNNLLYTTCPTGHSKFLTFYCLDDTKCVENYRRVAGAPNECKKAHNDAAITIHTDASLSNTVTFNNLRISKQECISKTTDTDTWEVKADNSCAKCFSPYYYYDSANNNNICSTVNNATDFAARYALGETNLHYSIETFSMDVCNNNRLDFCKYNNSCVNVAQIINNKTRGSSFTYQFRFDGPSTCETNLDKTTVIPLRGVVNGYILAADCNRREGWLSTFKDDASECVQETDCKLVFVDENGQKSCSSAVLTTATCQEKNSFVFGTVCYRFCPAGYYTTTTECKAFSECTDKLVINNKRIASCTTNYQGNYLLGGSTQIYFTPELVDTLGLYKLMVTPSVQADLQALWPDECPIIYNNKYLAVDHATKKCTEMSSFSNGCIKKINNHLEYDPNGTRAPETVLCQGTSDDSNFRIENDIFVFHEECLLADKEYLGPKRECLNLSETDSTNPCQNPDFRLFIKVLADNTIEYLRCEEKSSCDADHPYVLHKVCINIITSTVPEIKKITDLYTHWEFNLERYPTQTEPTGIFYGLKSCTDTTALETIKTIGNFTTCITYSKCLALGNQFIFDVPSKKYSCDSIDKSIHAALVQQGKAQVYIKKSQCADFSNNNFLRKLIWYTNEQVCKVISTSELKEVSAVDPNVVVDFIDTKFDRETGENGNILVHNDNTYTITAAEVGKYKFAPSNRRYYVTCPDGMFDYTINGKNECWRKEECISDNKYHQTNTCVPFADVNTGDAAKFLDFDLGYIVDGLTLTNCGQRLSLNYGNNRHGCISAVKCFNEAQNQDGNVCIETCPDLTYVDKNERICYTEEECRQNVYGYKGNQRFVRDDNKRCVTTTQCNNDGYYIDLWLLTCIKTCGEKVNFKDGDLNTCIQMCPDTADGKVQYSQITAGEEGTCDISCDNDQLRTLSRRSCNTVCPERTFEYSPDKECCTNLECRNKSETLCSFYGGKCDQFTRQASLFMSSDFICGSEQECLTGKLFTGNEIIGYPVIYYYAHPDSKKAWDLQCIRQSQLINNECPRFTFKNKEANFDKCYSEISAITDNLVLNYEKTFFKNACSATETTVRVGHYNRCVPTDKWISEFIKNEDVNIYRFVNPQGESHATDECDKANSVGYFKGTSSLVCKNVDQCDDDQEYLYFTNAAGSFHQCIHKDACINDRIIKVLKKDGKEVRRCMPSSECLSSGGHFLYRPTERICSFFDTCEYQHFIDKKCFSEDTCHINGEFIFKGDSIHCYTKDECEDPLLANGIVGRTKVKTANSSILTYTYKFCYTLTQCDADGRKVNNESRYCIPFKECSELCRVNDDTCNYGVSQGFCFKTYNSRFKSDPKIMYKYKHPVSTENCRTPLKSNFQAKECQESCTKFVNSTGNVCYNECKYAYLPDNFNLVRPYRCSEFTVRPTNLFVIEINDYKQLNPDSYLLAKTIPTGFKEQYGKVVRCDDLLVKQKCTTLKTCPEFTFPVVTSTTNSTIQYCRACNDKEEKAWFEVASASGVRTAQCVDKISEPALKVNNDYNAYKPCALVAGAAIHNGVCVTACPTGTTPNNGVCQTTQPGNAVLNGVQVAATTCKKNGLVYYNHQYWPDLNCNKDLTQTGDKCEECSKDPKKVLFRGECTYSCPRGMCRKDNTCVECSSPVEGYTFIAETDSFSRVPVNVCHAGCRTCSMVIDGFAYCQCSGGISGYRCNTNSYDALIRISKLLNNLSRFIEDLKWKGPCEELVSNSDLLTVLTDIDEVFFLFVDDNTGLDESNGKKLQALIDAINEIKENETLLDTGRQYEVGEVASYLEDSYRRVKQKLKENSRRQAISNAWYLQ